MASIEEEMMQSRKAAEAITNTDVDKEREARIRGEMMARYSGGKQHLLSPQKADVKNLWRTFRKKNTGDEAVYSGEMTPREYFRQKPGEVNYTGVGKYMPLYDGIDAERKQMIVSGPINDAKNDFVSALYNGETPLEEWGVIPIDKDSRVMYKNILGDKYKNVTGKNFRGYQLEKETLPFANMLDEKVLYKMHSQKFKGYSPENEKRWRIGEKPYIYDAGGHQMVVVDHHGKKYYKLVDVFDTAGTSKMPIEKNINAAISSNEIPYIVTTPWRELKDGEEW